MRYIAVNDGYDSIGAYDDMTPFRHLVNEMYARDASKKIKTAFQTKMKAGHYIGSFAPYGYMKDPGDKNHLLVDGRAAPVVREIFCRAGRGERPKEIARSLNKRGILSPAVYRCSSRPHLNIENYSKCQEWTSGTICKMLRNAVYLGHTAQGKTARASFKSQVRLTKTADEWIVVENTHEPLVTRLTWDTVRQRAVSRKNEPKNCFENIFSGLAKCADCGRNMSTTGTRKKGAIANLVCGGYKLYGSRACSNHFMDYQVLYDAVLSEIRRQVRLPARDMADILENLEKDAAKPGRDRDRLRRTQAALSGRIREIDGTIKQLYEDHVSGKIGGERFERLLRAYEAEQQEAADRLNALSDALAEKSKTEEPPGYLGLIEELTDMAELTPELLRRLVDRIDIEQGEYRQTPAGRRKLQKIKIHYRFMKGIHGSDIA